jgi:hypothetical protein
LPNWNTLLNEVQAASSVYDVIRRKYLRELYDLTGRNVIVYYSGWLQKGALLGQGVTGFELNDGDKTGFMSAIHGMDRSKGLDLMLHTPGGEVAATESLVEYLRAMFGNNIRAIVPELAMSAGTMVALSCGEIMMGQHSSLGPIDPQIGGTPAHGVIEEFDRAAREIKADPANFEKWRPIIAKYNPTLVGECQKAIDWSNEVVKDWLTSGMFAGDADADSKADRVVQELGDHALTLSHSRHISMRRASDLGLKVAALEAANTLQEAALTVHHACIQTLAGTNAIKLIENHDGVAFVQQVQIVAQTVPMQP